MQLIRITVSCSHHPSCRGLVSSAQDGDLLGCSVLCVFITLYDGNKAAEVQLRQTPADVNVNEAGCQVNRGEVGLSLDETRNRTSLDPVNIC